MKRNLLNALAGLAMLGAAASANAFLVPFQGHVGGSQFDIAGLGGAAGFTETLTLGATDSVSFSGMGGLAGMTVGQSVYAQQISAAGFFAYDYNGTSGFGNPMGSTNDVFGILNQVVFSGNATTTITGGGAVPASITSGDTNSGSFVTSYSGKFAALPGANGAAIGTLLHAGNNVSGVLTVNWTVAAGALTISLLDSALSVGWGGYEGVFRALDLMSTSPNGAIDGQLYLANGITPTSPSTFLLRNGNFVVTSVPEPASLALLGLGFAGLGLMRRRKA